MIPIQHAFEFFGVVAQKNIPMQLNLYFTSIYSTGRPREPKHLFHHLLQSQCIHTVHERLSTGVQCMVHFVVPHDKRAMEAVYLLWLYGNVNQTGSAYWFAIINLFEILCQWSFFVSLPHHSFTCYKAFTCRCESQSIVSVLQIMDLDAAEQFNGYLGC